MMIARVEMQRTGSTYRQAKELPKDVLLMIFDRLSETDLARSRRVCRQWSVFGRDERLMRKFEYAFGARAWYQHFGRVGVEPSLPMGIEAILTEPCPFWFGKKVYETHLLVLIPAAVSGVPFTLESLGEMIERPKLGHATRFSLYGAKKEHGNKVVQGCYWMLMTRDVLPGSRNKSYRRQKELVENYRSYKVPKLIEVATCVLMEHVKTGKRLYGEEPTTYTRCQEKIFDCQGLVGDFSPEGLNVSFYPADHGNFGVGAARKL